MGERLPVVERQRRHRLLRHLHGGHQLVAVCVPKEATGDLGRKLWMPSPIHSTEIDEVIGQHLDGSIAPRLVRSERKDREWTEGRATCIGAYVLRRDREGKDWARWICLDVDGPDHATGDTDEAAWQRALAIHRVMAEAGLRPVLERSHGAKGWHVWSIWSTWCSGAFAFWLGRQVVGAAGADIKKVEAFPKQAVLEGDTKPGNLVALPWPGRPAGEGGGEIVDLAARPLLASSITMVGRDELEHWLEKWRQTLDVQQRRRQVLPPDRRRKPRRREGKQEDVDVAGIDLAAVARAFGEVTDENVGGELALDCPRHQSRSKRSLLVDPQKRSWICFGCQAAGKEIHGGQGDGAAYSLARFLLPDHTNREVFDALRELEEPHV